MKIPLVTATLTAALATAIATAIAVTIPTTVHAADVGVSISVGQPGFYGVLDIGDFPQPRTIYREPIYIEREAMYREPIYLRVPPGHRKHWRDHCREYSACGERVMFVEDDWYNREYVPRYQERHHERRDYGRDEHRDDRRGNDRQGNDRDDDRGNGNHDNGNHGRGRDR